MLQKAETPARLEHPQDFLQNRFHPVHRAENQGSDHGIHAGVLHSQVLCQTSPQSDRPVQPSGLFPDVGMEMGIGLDTGPAHFPGQVGQIDAASGPDLHDLAGEITQQAPLAFGHPALVGTGPLSHAPGKDPCSPTVLLGSTHAASVARISPQVAEKLWNAFDIQHFIESVVS